MANMFYGTKIAYLKLNIRDLNLLKNLIFTLIVNLDLIKYTCSYIGI